MLWAKVLSETDQQHMVGNLVAHLKAGVRRDIIDPGAAGLVQRVPGDQRPGLPVVSVCR